MRYRRLLTLPYLEVLGIVFVLSAALFMRALYSLSGGELVGILFGAVNDSPWEYGKTLLLPYLLWGMLELMCARPSLRRFTSAKTAGLYSLGALYISARLCLPILADDPAFELVAAALCLVFAAIITRVLLRSTLALSVLFPPAISLLMLFLAFYYSFTPFPPSFLLNSGIFYRSLSCGI